MKKADIEIGAIYEAKVSGKVTRVRILYTSPFGGWVARNIATDRDVRVKSAARLRSRILSGSELAAKADQLAADLPYVEGAMRSSRALQGWRGIVAARRGARLCQEMS